MSQRSDVTSISGSYLGSLTDRALVCSSGWKHTDVCSSVFEETAIRKNLRHRGIEETVFVMAGHHCY